MAEDQGSGGAAEQQGAQRLSLDALRHGATREQLMEAIWVAAEMRAGGAYAHSLLAIDEMEKAAARPRVPQEGDA